MLVPYPAGGITDALPRIMMETCRETDTALNRFAVGQHAARTALLTISGSRGDCEDKMIFGLAARTPVSTTAHRVCTECSIKADRVYIDGDNVKLRFLNAPFVQCCQHAH